MTTDLTARIETHLTAAGYTPEQIKSGITYADATGYADDDEALSLTTSRILYSDDELADGARFAVEPGSWK